MKKLILIAASVLALAFAGTAAATLVPGVFDPGNTGCPTATYSNGVLHLAKNCATVTNAAAGADITGLNGQAFTSASFTLATAAQCQGGSPRFDVVTSTATFFLGCNNVTPTTNADGTATYTFTQATLAAAGNQVPFPTGTVKSIDVLIDVQGTADVGTITVNGQLQEKIAGGPTSKAQCKKGGWRTFADPSFKNQGQCVSWFEHHGHQKHQKHQKPGHEHHG
jgi:hypothetical protein